MGLSRTATALMLLFAGAMALLILRYDPWVYAGIIDNPLVSVPLTAALALAVGLMMVRRVPDPGRAVITRDGRFLRIDPRGRVPLLPGRDEIANVPSLAEHEVLHWPVTVYTADGTEHLVIFDLTWRLVPSATRPVSLRERRILQASEERCQRIVQQVVEGVVRGLASGMTYPVLRDSFVNLDLLEAIRQVVCARLIEDALTVDRLHLQRIYAGEKPKEPASAQVTPAPSAPPPAALAPASPAAPLVDPATSGYPPGHAPEYLQQPPRLVPRGIGPEQIGPEPPRPGPM